MSEDSKPRKDGTLGEIAEDASGFGVSDLRLTWDLIVRPRAAMDAYDEHGATAGGRYPRPLRYYIALNGLNLLLTALVGGYEGMLNALPIDIYESYGKASGKVRAEFLADFEQWLSLFTLPVMTLILAFPLFLVISRWSPLDWRRDLAQTFTYLNAWTLYMVPFGLVMLVWPEAYANLLSLLMLALAVVVYGRVGAGRWWRTTGGSVGKGVLLLGLMILLLVPASFAATALALVGANYAP